MLCGIGFYNSVTKLKEWSSDCEDTNEPFLLVEHLFYVICT
jgi:hypothetical protein